MTTGPRTTKEALLAELLGDLGEVHDSIKELPAALSDALKPSFDALAEATRAAQALIESANLIADGIAEKLARESLRVETASKALLERLEAIEAKRTANGQHTAQQLVNLMAEKQREMLREYTSQPGKPPGVPPAA